MNRRPRAHRIRAGARLCLCACLAAALLCGCSSGAPAGTLAPAAPEGTLCVRPSDEGAADFLALLGDGAPRLYENDTCSNVTPDFIKDNSGYLLFKFGQSCASFLQYDGTAYPLGEFFGGSGADGFALADLNGDGAYELYFTFSWGSGIHRSQVGYFDPAARTVTLLGASFYDEDAMLSCGENGALELRLARFENRASFVSYDVTPGDTLGTLYWADGEVRLDGAPSVSE